MRANTMPGPGAGERAGRPRCAWHLTFSLHAVLALAALLFASGRAATAGEGVALPPDQERAGQLLEVARVKAFTPAQCEEAAALLDSEDPFTRAMAEWALAFRIEQNNSTQKLVWPQPNPPAWFRRWMQVPPEALLEMDYVRQAVQLRLHRDPRRLAASAGDILRRAESVAADLERSRPSAEALASARRQLAELAALRARIAGQGEDLLACQRLWLQARKAARAVVLLGPDAGFRDLLFVKAHSGHSLQNITGACYPWTQKPGGGICVQTGLDPAAPVREVLQGRLGPGHVHGIDLWWDADRVLFGYARQPAWPPRFDTESGDFSFELRKEQPPTRLYEVGLDGAGLRPIGGSPPWSDFEPAYLPNGDIVFASDRSGRSSECGKFSADHTVINLYRCAPDGSAVRRLSDNKDIDRYPHVLDDGQIAYTHWEYQERHFFEVHAAWAIRPDGTRGDAVANQHLGVPYGLRDTRSVPGGGGLIAIGAGHHTLAYGPVLLVRPQKGLNAPASIASLTPDVKPQEGPAPKQAVPQGGVRDGGGLWQTPWALSPRAFLGAYSYGPVAAGKPTGGFALYLADAYGNKELLHRDRLISCSSPIPVLRRARPPVLPDAVDPRKGYATAYVADVYAGLEGVPRGSVKALRILQHVGWPLDARVGALRWIPGNAWEARFGYWSWSPTRVVGTVPVAADGSACFRVPVDAGVYFQALDERGLEVRRMRTSVTFQPGETRGCIGCHETRPSTLTGGTRLAAALSREPAAPVPPPWGDHRLLDYEELIQPLLERRCVGCHGATNPQGGVELSSRRAPDGFLQSFRTMFGAKWGQPTPTGALLGKVARGQAPDQLVVVSDRLSNGSVSRARQFGSSRSRLITALLPGGPCRSAPLPPEEWETLTTWVDANAPYYGTFLRKRDDEGKPLPKPVRVPVDIGPAFAPPAGEQPWFRVAGGSAGR